RPAFGAIRVAGERLPVEQEGWRRPEAGFLCAANLLEHGIVGGRVDKAGFEGGGIETRCFRVTDEFVRGEAAHVEDLVLELPGIELREEELLVVGPEGVLLRGAVCAEGRLRRIFSEDRQVAEFDAELAL